MNLSLIKKEKKLPMNLNDLNMDLLLNPENAYLLKELKEEVFSISVRLKNKMDSGVSVGEIDAYRGLYLSCQNALAIIDKLG